ncbi:MAG: HD family phosphohydrolase [Gemmatimonadales bacterium]
MSHRAERGPVSLELIAKHGGSGKVAFHGVRWGLLLSLALLTYLLFPVARGFDVVEVGEVAPSEVIAPFKFVVKKSADEIERERAAYEATVKPIYEYRREVIDTALERATTVFSALEAANTADELIEVAQMSGLGRLRLEEAEYLMRRGQRAAYENAVRAMIRRQLVRGVPAPGFEASESSREILIRRGNMERVLPRDSVTTFERFLASRISVHPDPNSQVGDQLFVTFLRFVFRPTLVARQTETEALRQQLREAVDPIRDTVRKNERIVDANQLVTQDIHDRLLALRINLLQQGRTELSLTGTLGQILTNGLLLALFWVLLMLFLPETYESLRRMLVLTLLFVLVMLGTAAKVQFLPGDSPELTPIPFAAMLITILFGGRIAMVSAMVLAVLLGSQAAFGGGETLFILLMGGVAAALSVRTIRRRNQLLLSVVVVTAAFSLAGLTTGLRLDASVVEVGRIAGLGGVNALISAALVTITLPLFESMAAVTTELTLLELSDPNRPLLRRLATETPGTYAHSIALANLCESACNVIGANGLLARVGCYYHDVGKLKKPQFFAENQTPGQNPHDKLKPEVSAEIIRNHVKEGISLATEQRLPDAIKAFICEHHGTMEITYFLDRARSRDVENEINCDNFRYPGPKPQSVETAVVMLGDGVEAALRVLEDTSAENVTNAVDHLIRQRIEAGQLDEAPLTMAQVTQVRAEFIRVYGRVHHNRIDYPAATGGLSAEWDGKSET